MAATATKTDETSPVLREEVSVGKFFTIAQKIEKPPSGKRFDEVSISPEEADFILKNYNFPRQREINQQWAIEIGLLIDKAEFAPTSLHFAHCKENGKVFMVDGYHRMEGLAVCGRSFVFPVAHHYCNTKEEVNDLYSKMDQGIPRRMNAALRAHGLEEKYALPRMYMERVAAAVQVIKHDFRQPWSSEQVRSSSERIHLLEEWIPEADMVYSQLQGGVSTLKDKLQNSALLAVCLVLMRYQPEKAASFIHEIAHNEGESGSPSKAMVAAIMNRGKTWGRNISEQTRIMANAWNAHFDGRSVSVVMTKDPKIPVDLLGTPWAGPKQWQSGPNIGKTKIPYEQKFRAVQPYNERVARQSKEETTGK